ncbi:MAG TPA: sensor histidine kinase N-terminal domain-containing protein [Rhodocyclaceae bacterium]|nr:sensor histidine kinase N-terminal domain-containing protein [Rhodocyclaceae bacterium]
MPADGGLRWRTVFDTLLSEILLWLLIILMMVWAIGVVMIYNVTGKFANEPYDVVLANNVGALANQVDFSAGRITINLPRAARDMLVTDPQDKVFFQIMDMKGALLVGDAQIPWVPTTQNVVLGKVFLRDDTIHDEEVRVAWQFKQVSPSMDPVLIQVAETRNKRNGMAARIVSSVIVPQFAIVPIAVLLIYFAVSRGITPLHRLQDELRARRPSDLSAISLHNIPAEIRPLIEALNDTMARLDESLSEQRRFIADAAHQLKTPLTGLRTQAELALREGSPERLQARVRQMLNAIERLADMTQKLLMLARTESMSAQSALVETIDLAVAVPEVAREWGVHALAKRIELSFENYATGACRVQGNARLLYELFANLIDNAIRYTPEGGHVAISLRDAAGICVEIEDSGIGIPAEERDKVFDRFYRVLGTHTDGSGLGLSIVKEIAALHNILISLHDSNLGGTRVVVAYNAHAPRRVSNP